MSGPLVIKIGGSTLGSADTTFRDVAGLAAEGSVPVVVHGGGAEASKWLEAMQIPSRFERGLRVTDARVLPVVVAVFAGLVNKRIVSAINAAGAPAVGLCGADGRILECRIAAPELGFVGEPVAVHPRAISALHQAGIIPVIGPIGFVPGEDSDQLVNVNADTVAGNIASALGASRLVFLTDVEGVRDGEGTTIPRLSGERARALIAEGAVSGGMIPKVEACLHALSLGVRVQIVDGRQPGILRALDGAGTVFEP
ncbi:MAG: acetylglutamate kinase [Dehalococcoidia bacterium]|nr:acetylglutamate kinase [Dehalococcoidia bacterium]